MGMVIHWNSLTKRSNDYFIGMTIPFYVPIPHTKCVIRVILDFLIYSSGGGIVYLGFYLSKVGSKGALLVRFHVNRRMDHA
jgi:hypothetical protein